MEKILQPEEFLNSLINYEKIPGYQYDLTAYKLFLEKIGAPQKKLKNVILIAGTKGKGSTATIINSCLIANGYKVGLFTSPHLLRITERIKINNKELTKKQMEKYIRLIRPHINFKTRIGARTFFEVLTAIAFMHFAKNQVDFAVLEVGLGGRLDATNVVDARIPVITRIGYDHMNLLGNRLSQIAYEKAGIIREAIPLNPSFIKGETGGFFITIHQHPSVEKLLKRIARERKNKIIYADELQGIKIKRIQLSGTKMHIKGPLGKFDIFLPLVGAHQLENLKIALAVLYELKNRGFPISISAIKKGLTQVKLSGRFEIISQRPLVIYDVAHNEDSFCALNNNLKNFFIGSDIKKQKELYIVFGCSRDKDINYAIKYIFPEAKQILLVRIENPRAMEPLEIYKRAKKYQKNLLIAGSIKRALEYISAKNMDNLITLIFGSFYLYPDVYSFYHHYLVHRNH